MPTPKKSKEKPLIDPPPPKLGTKIKPKAVEKLIKVKPLNATSLHKHAQALWAGRVALIRDAERLKNTPPGTWSTKAGLLAAAKNQMERAAILTAMYRKYSALLGDDDDE